MAREIVENIFLSLKRMVNEMPYRNIAQVKAIESKNKEKMLYINKNLDEHSGIYFLTRTDESGINYAYIGQAKHILTRLAQHLSGYQHIDLSLKKHGLYSNDNIFGWKVNYTYCNESSLDKSEQYFIEQYAKGGYQLRNKKLGGQCQGNTQIDEYKPSKGYRDGLSQGYKNASKEVANLFEKHLNYSRKSDKPNKNQDKAVEKFQGFLGISNPDMGVDVSEMQP